MKKVLSFVLVLSMILGSFGMAFAAPASDVAGTKYEDAVTALTELGVVAGYADGSFKPANIVTRAEMATFLIKAMGLADYAVGKSAFTDMAGHWADPFVAYAADLGFVKGNTDGTFNPNATVSYDQAITMVVQALGYKAEYLIGSYPGAFVNKAKALGILDGIVSGVAGANRGDVATLIYNALDEDIVRYDEDGRAVADGGTMRGRLTGIGASTGYLVEKQVIIGDEDAKIDLMPYQGAYVDYYTNKAGDIVAIKEVKSVFLTGTVEEDVTADAVYLPSGSAVKFVVGDTKYVIDQNAMKTEWDAKNATSVAFEFTNGRTGSVAKLVEDTEYVIAAKVSGKTIKEIYSISEWDANATYQWDVDTMVEDLEEDFMIDIYEFAENDDKEIDTTKFTLVGVDSLDDLKDNDVITVYKGGFYITKVEVCRDVVEGKITEVKTDKVVINGKDYKANNAADSLVTGEGELALAKEGKFYLDAAGKIAFADTTGEEAHNFAVVELAPGTDGTYDNTVAKIKLLNAEGKKVVYTFEEKTSTNAIYTTGEVVDFELDKNGEIDSITKPAIVSGHAMTLTAKGYLDGIKVASNVVVFEYDLVDGYSVSSLADVPTNKSMSRVKYVLNNDQDEIIMIVMDTRDAEEADGVYGVVVSTSNMKDADDEDIVKVVMLVDGKEVTYYTDEADNYTKDSFPTSVAYEVVTKGDKLTSLAAITTGALKSTDAAFTSTVGAIEDGNLKVAGKFVEVADDVIVYELTEDGYVASSFAKIAKKDAVVLYQLDAADKDKDGVDLILFQDK